MRLALISDIHGNSEAFSKVVDDFQKRGIVDIILLGDYLFKGPNPQGVLNLIKNLNVICCIRGNTDKFMNETEDNWKPKNQAELVLYDFYLFMSDCVGVKEKQYIEQLPEKQSILVDKIKLLCVHGSPRLINERMTPDLSDEEFHDILLGVEEHIILSGHTHIPYLRRVGDKIIINPGAVGFCNADDDNRASYAILNIIDDKLEVEFVKVDYVHQDIVNIGALNKFPHLDLYGDLIRNY